MDDRLVWLLNCFELRARVFQSGPLCHASHFDGADGLGYIHLLRGGSLRIETPAQPATLVSEPTLLLYMNPTDHRLLPQGEGVDMVCASFDFGAGSGNPLAQGLPEGLLQPLADMSALATVLQLMFEEAAGDHCGRQAVLDRLMEVVIVQVLRDLMDHNRLKLGLLAALAQPQLAKAINAMHAQPARPWTLEELAAVAGMSRARFANRFRDTVGTTPGHYLTTWRLGMAQSLLRRGKPVQLVADQVGYASASALSRAFAGQLGLSPSAWKKQHT